MSKFKLIALDMDGTLLNEEQSISAENRDAIQAALKAGVTVMLSTGRGIQSALPYAVELGLQTPMVTVNGSEVWKSPNELYRRTLLSTDLLRSMHEIAIQYDTWWWGYSVAGMFNKEKWITDIESFQWLKFGYYSEDIGALTQIRSTLEGWGLLEITNSHPNNLELNPLGISKVIGVREVCGMLGIDMSQVIAMGDSGNDITMIREAGLGVAMGNAQDLVKEIADVVTVTNDEHGVAKIIREYVLQA